jgi:hypothetical protein
MARNLSNETKLVSVLNSVAAGQTTQNSSIVDMAGYDGVMFVLDLGTVTATSVITLIGQDNTANSGTGMTTITDPAANNAQTQVTDVGGAASNGLVVLDIAQPQKRYVRAQVTIGTANAALDGIVAILYRSKSRPTVQDATVVGKAFFVAAS